MAALSPWRHSHTPWTRHCRLPYPPLGLSGGRGALPASRQGAVLGQHSCLLSPPCFENVCLGPGGMEGTGRLGGVVLPGRGHLRGHGSAGSPERSRQCLWSLGRMALAAVLGGVWHKALFSWACGTGRGPKVALAWACCRRGGVQAGCPAAFHSSPPRASPHCWSRPQVLQDLSSLKTDELAGSLWLLESATQITQSCHH